MSRENLDVVSGAIDALNRADVDAVRDLFHPDGEWHDQWEFPGSTVHLGVEAVLGHFKSVMEDLADWRTDVETLEEAPDGRVVVSCRIAGQGRGSGVHVERLAAVVFTVREGKIARGDVFGSKSQALEAVGLSE